MNSHHRNLIEGATHGGQISNIEKIQNLWSGYGEILRINLIGGSHTSVILKHIKLPKPSTHPRGWNTDISHQRKLKSYQTEYRWYQRFAHRCSVKCPVPHCLHLEQTEDEIFLLLTDLAGSGFPVLRTPEQLKPSAGEIHACLNWLAHFHALFINDSGIGLWPCGTYWHLDTRPDELHALKDTKLKQAAPLLDQALKNCSYQTLVHGDAKLANFCFSEGNQHAPECLVAAVDFQYVGIGCGMKDVAYFLGSCLYENECREYIGPLLNVYFDQLKLAVQEHQPEINFSALEQAWRNIFDIAWADFHRFLKGWSSTHWKLNSYSEHLTQNVIQRLLSED